MTPTNIFMIDIETAGTDHGSAILEIAAAEFDIKTAEIIREWDTAVDFLDSARLGLTIDSDTAAFHLKNRFQGHLRGSTLWRALNALDTFLHLNAEEVEVWAWGLDFETTHLKAACAAASYVMPWKYWETMDARTTWKIAFPGVKHSPRPHRAADDVRAQIADLTAAMANLQRKA